MTKKTQKLLFIVMPILIVLIIGTALTVLYFTTDFLKSDKTLFLKYVSQNVDIAKAVLDNTEEKEYTNMLRQNKYESITEISGVYTEKINTSEENKNNDINKVKIISENQSDYLNGYDYKNIKVLYNDTNLFKAEYIHDDDIYGLRFPEKFNQFLTFKSSDLKKTYKSVGLTDEQINILSDEIEEIDYNKIFSFTDEEIAALQDRYLNIINMNISDDKFSKQKDAVITIEKDSYSTTAYSVILTQEQANDIYIKILEQLKDDDILLSKISEFEQMVAIFNYIKDTSAEISDDYLKQLYIEKIEDTINYIEQNNIGTNEIKYTVYVSNGKTIRTQIVDETEQTTIDSNLLENGIEVDIKNKIATDEQEIQKNIYIIKNKNDGEIDFSIKYESILGEKTATIELYRNKNIGEKTATVNNGIRYNDGVGNLLNIKVDEAVSFNEEMERKVELNESNSVLTSDYDDNLVESWINYMKDFAKNKLNENQQIISNITKIKPISIVLGERNVEPIVENGNATTQVDKERFNAKFEFYTGTEKKYEDVVLLLEDVKNNLKNAQVSYSNEGTTDQNKKLQEVVLSIEEGTKNEEVANEIIEKLEKNRKYNIEVTKNSNDMVDKITINIKK